MAPARRIALALALASAAGLASAPVSGVAAAELKPRTVEAFDRYVRATEARIDREVARAGSLLHVDAFPEPRRRRLLLDLARGEVWMERLETVDDAGHELGAPDALIHHWVGGVFVPGVTLDQALALVQDYDQHQEHYRPDVVRSRLLARTGDDFRIFYRLRKKKVVTVTLDTEHEVHYVRLDPRRAWSRSRSLRMTEIEQAGEPDEREKPPGKQGGFLWRMNSYWRFEERDGGVYVESESVSLTRDIPAGLGWLVRPFVTGVPRETLRHTLEATRAALLARVRTAQSPAAPAATSAPASPGSPD